MGSGGGPSNKTVEYECVNQLDCEPGHLIGKLFQIATSHQVCHSLTYALQCINEI